MPEKAKKKRKKKAPTSVSVDRNGVASWGDKEDGELSDSSTHSTEPAVTDDEDRLVINEMAVESRTNQDKQPDEAQLAENTTDDNPADNNQKTDNNEKTNEEHKILKIHQQLQQRKHAKLRKTRSQQMRQKQPQPTQT